MMLVLIIGSMLLLMVLGVPAVFSFMFVNTVGVFFFFGGEAGLRQLILSIRESVALYSLLPVPMFVLMGEVMFHSGIAPRMMDTLDKWLGRLPGRLSLLAVGGGTLFATLSGASMASVAMLGSVLVPEMEKRGYQKPMSLGPILGSGGLSIMIPPSSLGVILASLGRFSIGQLLIAIIIPGLIMAVLYVSYIILRSRLQPHLAPTYEVPHIPLSNKLLATVRYILPLAFIIFLVVGVIFIGAADPTEASAAGALGCFILAACYRRLNWELVKKSIIGTLQITVMVLMIIGSATAFSQLLAYTGATRGLVMLATGLPVTPILILVSMQVVLLVLGSLMDQVAIMMITLPIFMPVIYALDFNPVWFGAIMLLNMEMATTSPPFGMSLFVMKGVAPPDTTMGDIYLASLPFLGCDLIVMVIMIAFPALVLWLPNAMF
jgi:tripartite ATP-independent transporter DctM subunit